VIFLLADPDYFNISPDRLGEVSGLLIFVSMPIAIIGTFFIGYIYDIVGRRLTLFLSFFIGSILTALVPWTSPNVIPWLLILRAAIQLCLCAPASSPLTADYIHKDSIGKGVSMQGVGLVIGEVITMGLLFRLTAEMKPWLSFAIVGGIGLFFSFFFLFIVKEPKLRGPVKTSSMGLQPS
jgi:MFS family permease